MGKLFYERAKKKRKNFGGPKKILAGQKKEKILEGQKKVWRAKKKRKNFGGPKWFIIKLNKDSKNIILKIL